MEEKCWLVGWLVGRAQLVVGFKHSRADQPANQPTTKPTNDTARTHARTHARVLADSAPLPLEQAPVATLALRRGCRRFVRLTVAPIARNIAVLVVSAAQLMVIPVVGDALVGWLVGWIDESGRTTEQQTRLWRSLAEQAVNERTKGRNTQKHERVDTCVWRAHCVCVCVCLRATLRT